MSVLSVSELVRCRFCRYLNSWDVDFAALPPEPSCLDLPAVVYSSLRCFGLRLLRTHDIGGSVKTVTTSTMSTGTDKTGDSEFLIHHRAICGRGNCYTFGQHYTGNSYTFGQNYTGLMTNRLSNYVPSYQARQQTDRNSLTGLSSTSSSSSPMDLIHQS
nr:protein phosphatase 1 regulatory subunit 12A-like [Biomphalaria glabrata]